MHLIHRESNAEYARAPVTDAASVEKCVDSSRYFVIRCVNPKVNQKIFIGIAFNERNDAFEFNVALQEFEKFKQQRKSLANAPNYEDAPSVDMSIKNGEKIRVKASFAGSTAARRRKGEAAAPNLVGKGGGLLAPPHKDTPSRRQIEAFSSGGGGGLAPPQSDEASSFLSFVSAAPSATASSSIPRSALLAPSAAASPPNLIQDPFAPKPSAASAPPSEATDPSDPFNAPPSVVAPDSFAPPPEIASSGTSISDPFAGNGGSEDDVNGTHSDGFLSMTAPTVSTGLGTGIGGLSLSEVGQSAMATSAFSGGAITKLSHDPFASVSASSPEVFSGSTRGQSGSQFDSLGGLPTMSNSGNIGASDPFTGSMATGRPIQSIPSFGGNGQSSTSTQVDSSAQWGGGTGMEFEDGVASAMPTNFVVSGAARTLSTQQPRQQAGKAAANSALGTGVATFDHVSPPPAQKSAPASNCPSIPSDPFGVFF